MTEDPMLFRKLVESSTDGLWLLDGEGNTLFANPRMAELLGRTPEQMAGLSAYDVHDEQGKVEFAEHLRLARSGDAGHDDRVAMYVRADGTPIWLLASWRPIHDEDGSLVGFLHHYSDYTQQRLLLRAVEQREQLMADAQAITGIGSWEWDVLRDETWWSDQLYLTYGVGRDYNANYEGFLALIHPEDRQHVQAAIASIFTGADRFEFTARIIREGQVRWCQGMGRVVRDDTGRPARVIGTNQDVTDHVAAEREVAKYTRRLALLREVAETANRSTSLVETVSRSAETLGGTASWEPLGALTRGEDGALTPLLTLGDRPPWAPAPDAALAERAWQSQQVEHVPLPDREHSHSLVAIPILHGGGVACVVELVGAEAPLGDASRDLMAQIATQLGRVAERERAAAELAEARDQAMEGSRLKSEFLATMSHEIRTPMNGVVGLTDLLLRTNLNAEQRRLAEALHGAGRTLRGIINDILDLSKIEAGRLELELEDFEVRAAVEQTMELVRAPADDRGLDLELVVAQEVPTCVRGDSVRWSQILANLASNAVKFTDVGGVTIRVDLVEDDPAGVTLGVSVTDTGAGISPAARQRVFDAFTQADPSTTRRHGGTGLGLTIARQLVEALGGSLTVESEVGRGSTFRFTARFAPAIGDVGDLWAPDRGDQQPPDTTLRVLVVEDNQVNQLVAVGLLENAGYETAVAIDGVQAVEMLAGDHAFAAVLMDCRMPRMDGFEATREIRAQEAPDRHVPIIAMTASALEGERERCLTAGMDDFLTKPVDSQRLHQVVSQWVASSRQAPPQDAGPEATRDAVVDTARLDMLHQMVKDGVSLFQRSSANFIDHAPDHLSAIGAAIEAADADELMATAHKLKGSALNLGLPRVGEAALDLEERGRSGSVIGADRAFGVLAREMRDAVSALERERAARG